MELSLSCMNPSKCSLLVLLTIDSNKSASLHSLAPERCYSNLKIVISKHMLQIKFIYISSKIAQVNAIEQL